MAASEHSDSLISAETAAVMALMDLGSAATNVSQYRAHCQHLGGRESADVYRESALKDVAKVREALDRMTAVLVASAPAEKVAA